MGMAGDDVVVVVVGQYDSYKKQIYAHYYIIIYAFNNQVSVSASQCESELVRTSVCAEGNSITGHINLIVQGRSRTELFTIL